MEMVVTRTTRLMVLYGKDFRQGTTCQSTRGRSAFGGSEAAGSIFAN